MPLYLFANNAVTTLAGSISSASTTANLAAGTGSEFPSPSGGSQFALTFWSQGQDPSIANEIVYVTARSGDTVTMLRAQEGTTAQAWNAGDNAAEFWTAGMAATMVQQAQLQVQPGNYAVASGTNSLTATLTPAPVSLISIIGSPIRLKAGATNTGAVTLALNGLAATVVNNPDGSALAAGSIQIGHIFEVIYSGSAFNLMTTPFFLLQAANTWTGPNTFANNLTVNDVSSGAGGLTVSGTTGSGAVVKLAGNGATTPNKFIRVLSGLLQILSSAGSVALLALTDAGVLTTAGGILASSGDVVSGAGNVQSNLGKLRAQVGAFGSGDLNAGTLLKDFQSGGTSQQGWRIMPDGTVFVRGFAAGPSAAFGSASKNFGITLSSLDALTVTPANNNPAATSSWILTTSLGGFTFSCNQADVSSYYIGMGSL